ncbi:MAG: hypothetical protein IT561_24885, partial [Alphaproteobacteria bacterium]|nr:hypothetical protein [Alphaproteobacteria bacterium]
HPAVAVNWALYGSSGHRERPDGMVTASYTRRGHLGFVVAQPSFLRAPGLDPDRAESYRPMSSHVKSIVQPALTLRPVTPHHFLYRDGRRAVTETGIAFEGPWSPEVSVARLRINHYWSKSLGELERKTSRGYACAGTAPSFVYARAIERCLNAEVDTAIFPIAARMPGWRLPGRRLPGGGET